MAKQVKFTRNAQQVSRYAQVEALNMGHNHVGEAHILLGLIREEAGAAARVFQEIKIDLDIARVEIERLTGQEEKVSTGSMNFTREAWEAIENAVIEGYQFGNYYVGTEHLLLGLLKSGGTASKVLRNLGIDPEMLYREISRVMGMENGYPGEDPGGDPSRQSCQSCFSGEQGSSQTSMLDEYGRDLTGLAREDKLEPVIGRESELERVIQILGRRTKHNPCLLGEAGVGKTAIAEGLARKIAKREVPDNLQDKRVIQVELSSLIAGTKYRGEFEERMQQLMQELKQEGNVIVFIDEIHTVVGAGAAEGAMDASNILKPALSQGDLQAVGATTLEEYRKHIESDAALERRFQPVMVEEPSREESIEILKGLRARYQEHHRLQITDEALKAAVQLGSRYIQDRNLPDKAIDLIDEASSLVRNSQDRDFPKENELKEELEKVKREKEEVIKSDDFERAAQLRDKEKQLESELKSESNSALDLPDSDALQVTEEDIARVVSNWTGIPVYKLTEEEATRLMNLEETLHRRVIGQDKPVQEVSRAVRRSRAGLKDARRPAGSFMFLGPTGVGKTELARSLAEALFGEEEAMIRLDMSEYMEKHTTARLVGSPPGYVGYEEGGQLTEQVRRKPYSVVLLDEIEKAHPEVFNVLLQVLEDGRLTDGKGKTVDFCNTVVIMTSNVGTGNKQSAIGYLSAGEDKNYQDMKEGILAELQNTFRPEFLNRLDDVIVFRPLSLEDMEQIVDLELGDLSRRMRQYGLELEVSREAKNALAREGYEPDYGARPLKRVIQKRLEDRLSEEMIRGKLASGVMVQVDVEQPEDSESEDEGETGLVFNFKEEWSKEEKCSIR